MCPRRSGAAITTGITLLLTTTTALAQYAPPDPEVDQGVELRNQRRDAEALELFRRSWERTHTPRARAQMAVAEQALGRWGEADAHLREALQYANDPWIIQNRPGLDQVQQMIAEHVGLLEVLGGVDGAEVVFHGVVVARLPMSQPVSVVAETATLEVRAPGYSTVRRTIAVMPRVLSGETITLEPGEGDSGTTGSSGALRTAGIVGLAVGGAALAGGLVAWILRENMAAQYNDDARCNRDTRTRDQECPGERSSVETLSTLAGVGVGVGAAVGIAGAVVLVLSGRSAESATAALRLTPGPGTVGLGLTGVF